MFLKIVLNPYQNGHPTRSVLYRPNHMQTFAIDAEYLHRHPHLLNALGKGQGLIIRLLDFIAYVIALGGLIGSLVLVAWFFLPCLVATAAMLLTNRKTAGMIARKAAATSNENFLYLHTQKALWLVTEPAKKVVLELL